VLFAQGSDHHSQELLPVIGIYMELLRVHNTQLGIGLLDVVQILHSCFQSTHHSFSMLSHFGISNDGSVGGQVTKRSKMSLSPGVHNQNLGSDLPHIDLPPQS
uniref:Uncharacterized protein n=1 Tax=Cyprinodon variegatus TaxID=28743 RepID=A0A3Q2E7R4_CYPVA